MAGQLPANVTEAALVLVRLPGAGVVSCPVNAAVGGMPVEIAEPTICGKWAMIVNTLSSRSRQGAIRFPCSAGSIGPVNGGLTAFLGIL